jgi:hypothetical protein
MTKTFKKKSSSKMKPLSIYSQMLELSIDAFTERIRDEIGERIDTAGAFEHNDKSSIERALAYYHGTHSHLLTEYRRIKRRWQLGYNEFKRTETAYINFARKELPSKSVEKTAERVAYEEHGDELYPLVDEAEELEQKWKFVFGMAENVKNSITAIQSLAKIIVSEFGAARND